MPKAKLAHARWLNDNTMHVETELGIVNIYLGLHNIAGQKVESVEIIPDKTEHKVLVEDKEYFRVRMIEVEEK
jgi:hypothetical protein